MVAVSSGVPHGSCRRVVATPGPVVEPAGRHAKAAAQHGDGVVGQLPRPRSGTSLRAIVALGGEEGRVRNDLLPQEGLRIYGAAVTSAPISRPGPPVGPSRRRCTFKEVQGGLNGSSSQKGLNQSANLRLAKPNWAWRSGSSTAPSFSTWNRNSKSRSLKLRSRSISIASATSAWAEELRTPL